VDGAAATGQSITNSSLLELLRRRLGGGSSSGDFSRALECAPFFLVPAIALPFLEFADLAGARCWVLEEFPLSGFVGLRFVALEGDISSPRALDGDRPPRSDFSSGRRGGVLRFVGIVPFHLLQLLQVRLSGMRNKAQLSKGGALSDRSGCGGSVFIVVGR